MADNSHFYLEVTYSQFSFCLLLTQEGKWRFINASSPDVFGKDPNWQRGNWKGSFGSDVMSDFYTNDGSLIAFRLSHIRFLPPVTSSVGFYQNQFHLGDIWAEQLGITNAIERRGSWAPLATGPFITEVKQHAEQMQKEFHEICIMIGLDVAALIDPTGVMNFPAAVQASRMGDYLGCTLNLLGLIPLIGKAANAAKNARAIQRFNYLVTEIEFLDRWLKLSIKALRRGNAADSGLKLQIQGTTQATKTVHTIEEGVGMVKSLKNSGWIQKLGTEVSETMGILPEELKAFQRLAEHGYYFVVRACNPERLRWLRWANKAGARLLSKPMWIKWKTLKKSANSNGLVGMLKTEFAYAKKLREVASQHLPPGFNMQFLSNIAGAYPKPPKIYQVVQEFNVEGIEDGARLLDHYLVDMGDSYVLIDAKGCAYIGDIDIVSIQRRLGNGHFGPPGHNVGPGGQSTVFRGGSDSAELESFFNKFFKSVGYPPGYDVFQHGGLSGTAGFFGKNHEAFDFFGSKTLVGWSPKGDWDSEKLLVAVKGVAGTDGVGFAKSWEALKNFHEANAMGEFRFRRYTKVEDAK